jgi:hypothetical protein
MKARNYQYEKIEARKSLIMKKLKPGNIIFGNMIRYARGRETDNLKLTTVALSQSLSKSE